MITETYRDKYKNAVIALILDIQNNEAKINLPISQQPDLLDIDRYYRQSGGEFWVATQDGEVIGTMGLMIKEKNCAIMKKFFVKKEYRSQKIGLALYKELITFAVNKGIRLIILDTPSVAKASHRFYERSGFRKITTAELPVPYTYLDRDSILYMLDL